MATPPKGHSLRILFVDDEKHLQEFFRTELPRLGYEVTVCADGHEAFKILEKSKFDVAILDLRMPGVGGIEVLQRLKEVSPDTEAIIHTGHATESGSTGCPPKTAAAWAPAPARRSAAAGRSSCSHRAAIPARRCRLAISATSSRSAATG